MLIRGQTTEQRIGEIAKRFSDAGNDFAGFKQEQNRYNQQKDIQQESLKRQRALQSLQASNEIASQTGKYVDPSLLDPMLKGGDFTGIGDILKSSDMTPKMNMQMNQLDRQNKLTDSQINKNNSSANKSAALGGLTEGEKAVDKDYAKQYNTFSTKGNANSAASIEKLKKIASELESDSGVGESGGGRFSTMLPDFARSRDAIRRRDESRNAANSTLKELFGGQLSDAEREAAAKEYYNDALDNKTNAKILKNKIAQLEGARQAELERASYYQQNGSLKGFSLNQNPVPNITGTSGNAAASPRITDGQMSPEDMMAIDWAKQNASDPRAIQILQLHGIN